MLWGRLGKIDCHAVDMHALEDLLYSLILKCTPISLLSVLKKVLSAFSYIALTPNHRQSLYDNEQQIQDQFALFWERVAEKFQNNKYVLAYEVLNEPWVGDFYRHPDQLEPRK